MEPPGETRSEKRFFIAKMIVKRIAPLGGRWCDEGTQNLRG